MKNIGASFVAIAISAILSACAHNSDAPKQDSSSGLDLAPIAKRFSVPRCSVSVRLTQEEVLYAARRQGDPAPENRADWKAIVTAIRPGDELRQIACLTKGKNGMAAGDVFYGLFRNGELVAEMHNVIIN